ncbi:MAG: class I SAM-dependent methyltransferase [Nitrospirales bacterium]
MEKDNLSLSLTSFYETQAMSDQKSEIEEMDIINLLSDLKHRIFPRPFERLGVTGKELVGVEIGVYKGEHAESLLANLDIKRLYLVDPYELYEQYEEGRSHYGVDQDPLSLAKQEALQRLAPHVEKLSWIFKQSTDAVHEIPDELDFVYIDGNHDEEFVRNEILSFFPKIRHGGILGGHDFYNGFCREHDGVIRAVTKFSVKCDLPLQVELPDWWIEKTI